MRTPTDKFDKWVWNDLEIFFFTLHDVVMIYEVCSKIIANFEFPRVTYIRISILCRFSCFSFMPTSTAIMNVQLIFDSCFACTCFGSSSIFAYSKKWIKESVSNFVWKTKLSARTYSECWLWHMVKLTWTQATFIGGTKCIPRAEKMWTTKSVPDARARNNRRKHSWSEENCIDQSSNHR